MKKFFERLVIVASLVLIVWFLASWVDILSHQTPFHENYGQFASWNLFLMIFGM